MKKVSILFIGFMLSITLLAGNNNKEEKKTSSAIQGMVVDDEGLPLIGAEIRMGDQLVRTDLEGHFQLTVSASGKEKISVNYISYEEKQIELAAEANASSPLLIQLDSK
jgi:hypothetical protein